MKNNYIKPQVIRMAYDAEQLLISTSVPVGNPAEKSPDGSTDLSGSEAKTSFTNDDENDVSWK
ncbi:MAG: hypothetical protein PUF32_05245 [Prevotella sp.]|nr:hypothetical protein [Prevotella sp.]MDD7336902.1 hypothetical protein [Prevotella sp.]MDY5259361.1 hypothetical protein [Prevotella sp.]